jgi:hypothetical protein
MSAAKSKTATLGGMKGDGGAVEERRRDDETGLHSLRGAITISAADWKGAMELWQIGEPVAYSGPVESAGTTTARTFRARILRIEPPGKAGARVEFIAVVEPSQ